MSIEGKIKECGELTEYELPQETVWIALYKFQEEGGLWTSWTEMSKDKLLEHLRYSTNKKYGARIYSIKV
jgi:hypothetical protein